MGVYFWVRELKSSLSKKRYKGRIIPKWVEYKNEHFLSGDHRPIRKICFEYRRPVFEGSFLEFTAFEGIFSSMPLVNSLGASCGLHSVDGCWNQFKIKIKIKKFKILVSTLLYACYRHVGKLFGPCCWISFQEDLVSDIYDQNQHWWIPPSYIVVSEKQSLGWLDLCYSGSTVLLQ